MAQEYAQEVVDEIKGMVAKRMEELRAMDRETLNKEYLRVVGVEPHPRWHLDMMVKMIARFYQGNLWHDRTGDIPAPIRENDMKFWLNEEAFFVPKAAIKEEQASPVVAKTRKKIPSGPQGLPGSRGTGLQTKARNIEDAILRLVKTHTISNDPDIIAVKDILLQAPDNQMLYPDFAKHCKKKRLTKPSNMLALMLARDGMIDLSYPEDNHPVRPAPPKEEEEKTVTFKEVLKGVEKKRPNLIVEPASVDFGTGPRVSDYD